MSLSFSLGSTFVVVIPLIRRAVGAEFIVNGAGQLGIEIRKGRSPGAGARSRKTKAQWTSHQSFLLTLNLVRSCISCHLPPATCHLPPATCLIIYSDLFMIRFLRPFDARSIR